MGGGGGGAEVTKAGSLAGFAAVSSGMLASRGYVYFFCCGDANVS